MNIPNLNLPETTPSTPLKLYSDASYQENGFSSAGWVFANHNGKPLEVNGAALGSGFDSVEAEMEAIRRGVDALGAYCQVDHIKVFSDCEPALYHIEEDDIREEFDSVTMEWIPREENQVADIAADAFW